MSDKTYYHYAGSLTTLYEKITLIIDLVHKPWIGMYSLHHCQFQSPNYNNLKIFLVIQIIFPIKIIIDQYKIWMEEHFIKEY